MATGIFGWNPIGFVMGGNKSQPAKSPYATGQEQVLGVSTRTPQPRPGTGAYGPSAGQAYSGLNDTTKKPINYGGANDGGAAGGYSAGSAGSTGISQQNVNLINSLFGAKIAGLQGQLGTLDAQNQASQARIGNQFQTKFNDLQENLTVGNRNLDMSRNKVNESRARSLQDIRDRLQSQSMGYANQLGAYGAGDSSAAQQINMALSGMASKNRGDVQSNASDQLTTIDTQQSDLKREFDRNVRDLESWKQETLSNLATEILQKKQQIQQAIAQADAEKAQQLAQYDASYTQQAIAALQNLQNQYAAASAEMQNRYYNALAPQSISIDPRLGQYSVKPIEAGTLRDIGQVTPVNPEAEAIAVLRKRQEEEAANSILNPTIV